jgi:polyisoprenoid-binding protein YceI
MKISLIIISLFLLVPINAQRYISRNGLVWFYSRTPVEDIEARNNQAVSILDASSGDIQISLLIKSFEFKKALMQEHFNENYMNSDKFPKADFAGKIGNLQSVNFGKDGLYQVEVMGTLTIRGVTKPVTAPATIEIKNGVVAGKTKFIVKPQDYGITIPAVVENNIAREIEVSVDVSYNPA